MHILVTNDDGPPNKESSPYVLPFVQALESAGHTVSVILPHTQRSWIGKAHMVGQDVQATPYWPPSSTPEAHTTSSSAEDNGSHPWILVNSTPASCAQLGTSHFFKDRGAFDLVISGPNYGRNTTSLFAMSSGTIGAALEATQCGLRSVALSFAFYRNENPGPDAPEVVAESCKQGVRVCEWLASNAQWGNSVLYSVNVPVHKGVSEAPAVWTKVLQNSWTKGACFKELGEGAGVDDAGTEEARLRRQEGGEGSGTSTPGGGKWATRHFKWAPKFDDVNASVLKSGAGWDGWEIQQKKTSITALRANFMHADGGPEGEVKL